MLTLAGLLVILLIIYGIRYKNNRKRRWLRHSRQLQEAKADSAVEQAIPDAADSIDLEGIISDVNVHYQPEPPIQKSTPFKKATMAKGSGLLVLHIMAPANQAFIGYELLQALLSSGLRFGEMNIFHRYEQPTGQGKILFSLASATEPGTFNLDEIGSLVCIGLSLFMKVNTLENPAKVFNLMLDTARLLAEDLGAKVVDEHYQELTPETITHYQQQITV